MSTFSGLNTALSALRYNRVAMDVANGNIANASTDGYSRRRINGESVGAPDQPAMWSRYTGAGDGVRVGSVGRLTDALLDVRARREHGNQAYLDIRQAVLERVESGVGEPGDSGVAAAIADFRSAWHDLANNPGSDAARSAVLGRAATLADAIKIQARNIASESGDQRFRIQADVAEVNTVASDLAATNKSIAIASLNGTDAGVLLDKRDQLAMRLSELTGATTTARADGGLDVAVNGVPLVVGQRAGSLQIASGITPAGASDGTPISYAITDTSGTTAVPGGMTGEIGGVTDLLNTTLPAYTAGLDAIAQQLADEVNAQHVAGFDAAGNPGQPFFSYTPGSAASSLAVAITATGDLAASSIPGGGLDAGNATALAAATGVESSYQRLVNGFGTEVASVARLAANQKVLTTQVDGSREQLSGVSLDEETVSMLAAQHAYEAAARVLTTLDSVLDTLINRTGVTR
ncbi:flagellar hook-associated protein FlgK [Nocardioides marmoriginsengisoli]|uniref:Flagellar hook-associated protein 1 n=1 Tax=Nocardioides marmoriginsengisoli TaxID=661483 RepID=A0A3N0CDG5_9ACTN|nr:flagellar hook-associated protein FlgK [Nocardioides marmoriginsengisoli]RNL61043.1 flagellar hook-associated protein FlgK [Nocardioides marmoriginsengisoli]